MEIQPSFFSYTIYVTYEFFRRLVHRPVKDYCVNGHPKYRLVSWEAADHINSWAEQRPGFACLIVRFNCLLTEKIPDVDPLIYDPIGENIEPVVASTITTFPSGGQKEEDGKLMLSLVPGEFINATARAFSYGANKYSAHNWRKGIPTSKLYDALQRHLIAWNSGVDTDIESGLHHLDHASACLAMLVGTIANHPNLDDRFFGGEGTDDTQL